MTGPALRITARRRELLTAIDTGQVRAMHSGYRMALPETRWCWVTTRVDELLAAGLVERDDDRELRLTPAGRDALASSGGAP